MDPRTSSNLDLGEIRLNDGRTSSNLDLGEIRLNDGPVDVQ